MSINKKISVIIPLYNAEDYIKECIDSILNQTYENFELIVINDGSSDKSPEMVKEYEKKDKRVKLYNIENNGAGYARNMAIKKATGDYIMFVDSDDFIEPVTLEVAIKRIVKDESDFVFLDYKYYYGERDKYVYQSEYPFMKNKVLEGDDICKLLKISSYYTVGKLYSKKFLEDNHAKYGEHYIYEDVLFWVYVASKAKKVSLIHSPLYNIRVNDTSVTKTNHTTDKHAKGFLRAYDESIVLFDENQTKEKLAFIRYMLKRFVPYYYIRTPESFKQEFFDGFYDRLTKFGISKVYKRSLINRVLRKLNVLESKSFFTHYVKHTYKKYTKKTIKQELRAARKMLKRDKKTTNRKFYEMYSDNLKEQILFMGFDYRYTGNSRYLFEKMIKNENLKIYFATEDELVDEKYRIEPNSDEFYEVLYSSKIVIFESWISKRFRRPDDAVWIDLWHGPPLKKMLFDSNEEEMLKKNKKYKKNKFLSTRKMSYLLTDNENINHYFETSFLLDKDQILGYGYPRVEYLLENKNNTKLKEEIREQLGVSSDKKIVSYLPTWRDYNYQESDTYDFDYFLDIESLKEKLPENYEVLCKDHAFLSRNEDLPKVEIETQELLLVSDYLITDYSSIMFDAFAMDIPVCIIAKDYEKYSLSRGLYEDMWEDLQPFVRTNEFDLAKLLLNYKIDKSYKLIKDKYCYKKGGDLIKFIEKKLKEENND